MNQELLMKAQFLNDQAQELEQNLEVIDNEILQLQKMDENLNFLVNSKETSTISSIGKGLHIKTNIESKELFVESGSGVVIKKSPEEALKVIQNQIKKLEEARVHLSGKIDIYHRTIKSVFQEIQQEQSLGK